MLMIHNTHLNRPSSHSLMRLILFHYDRLHHRFICLHVYFLMITPSPKKLTVSFVVYCRLVNAYIITSATPIIGYISSLDSRTNDFNDILSTAPLSQFLPETKIFSWVKSVLDSLINHVHFCTVKAYYKIYVCQ